MIGMEFYQNVFDEFKTLEPRMIQDVADWYPSGQMEITIKLNDGSRIIYDYVEKTWQSIPDYAYESWITEKEWRDEFSRKLIRRMKSNGMTQADLAELTGLTQPQINNYVRGYSTPKGYTVLRLARALRCSVSELVDVPDLEKII